MDHEQTMEVSSRVLDQKQLNIFGRISLFWSAELQVTLRSWTEVTTIGWFGEHSLARYVGAANADIRPDAHFVCGWVMSANHVSRGIR